MDSVSYLLFGSFCLVLFLAAMLWQHISTRAIPLILPALSLLMSVLMILFSWQQNDTDAAKLPVMFFWFLVFVLNAVLILTQSFGSMGYRKR